MLTLERVTRMGGVGVDKLDLDNPLFATYVIAATLMILKAVAMSWLTVVRMMQAKGGFRAPEDLRKTPAQSRAPGPPGSSNPTSASSASGGYELNDLENLPFFLTRAPVVLTDPSLTLARWLLYGYVVSRLLHFGAYFTAQTHDIRATFWTVGSLILVFMTVWTLATALGWR